PELVGPHALFRRLDGFLGDEIGEEPRDGVGEERAHFHHRRPSPRARMPRKTSRVPPRSENEGATCVMYPNTCWRSEPVSSVGSTSRSACASSGIDCSNVVPTSFTAAASMYGFWPASSMPATES